MVTSSENKRNGGWEAQWKLKVERKVYQFNFRKI
jgi:hypothetical protein